MASETDSASSQRVRALASERGWSLRELARRAGLGEEHTVKLVRRGLDRASAEVVLQIARALGVSVPWLLTGTDGPVLERAPELRLEYVERYPSRREAAAALAGLVRQDAIDGVLRWHLHNEEDPGLAWWIERMKELARQADLRDKSPAAVEQDKQRGLADTERVRARLAAQRQSK